MDVGNIVVIGLVVVGLCAVFFQLFTRRGREWVLGGRIARTFGTPIVLRRRSMTTTISVHSLEPKHPGDPPRVGVEIANRAALSASTTPIILSPDEARALSAALREASEFRGAPS